MPNYTLSHVQCVTGIPLIAAKQKQMLSAEEIFLEHKSIQTKSFVKQLLLVFKRCIFNYKKQPFMKLFFLPQI